MSESSPSDQGRNETEKERLDRNLNELLQELRVALPGVQVLFAFLLTVPFQQGFQKATEFQKNVYGVTLLLTAVATALLITPSAYHRLEFRQDDKKHIVYMANRVSIIGFAVLAAAMTSAVLLVTDYLYSSTTSLIATIGAACVLYGLWYAFPLARRAKRARQASS
jgi:fumarate reductase subunit D